MGICRRPWRAFFDIRVCAIGHSSTEGERALFAFLRVSGSDESDRARPPITAVFVVSMNFADYGTSACAGSGKPVARESLRIGSAGREDKLAG
jgi:hypothetical protein